MKKLKVKLFPLALLVVFAVLSFLAYSLKLTLNITPSIKTGFYIKATGEIHRGDFVALCMPEPNKSVALSRGYIMTGEACKGTIPFLKQVLAVPGDDVKLTMDYMQVNGQRYFIKTMKKDHLGRFLVAYPRGGYKNTQGYWLIGTNSQNSWDSRYWGPVAKEQLLYRLHPLIMF